MNIYAYTQTYYLQGPHAGGNLSFLTLPFIAAFCFFFSLTYSSQALLCNYALLLNSPLLHLFTLRFARVPCAADN